MKVAEYQLPSLLERLQVPVGSPALLAPHLAPGSAKVLSGRTGAAWPWEAVISGKPQDAEWLHIYCALKPELVSCVMLKSWEIILLVLLLQPCTKGNWNTNLGC